MKRLVILACAGAVLISCAPPFNKDLSLSASVLGSLTPVGATVGPFGIGKEDGIKGIFFPEKGTPTGVDTKRGFIQVSNQWGAALWFAWQDATGKYNYIQAGGENVPNNPYYPPFQLVPYKSGDFIAYLRLAITGNPNGDDVFDFYSTNFTSNPPAISRVPNFVSTVTGFAGAGDRCLGMSIYPSKDAADQIYWLVREKASGLTFEAHQTIQSTPPSTFVGIRDLVNGMGFNLNSCLPDETVERCFYYHDPDPSRTHYGYVSYYSGGWQTWRFLIPNAAETTRITAIDKRVDALLTTGRLFSTQDQIGRVYDPTGTGREITHFDLGNLVFLYEAYDNSTPPVARVYFSQTLISNEEMAFKVYSIPTSELEQVR